MGGGHHGGGGHHHGGGGGISLVPYGFNWGQPDWYEPTSVVVVGGSGDTEAVARATAYIMSLPKAQRAYAYKKIFGKAPPKGALGDLSTALGQMGTTGYLALAAVAYFVIYKWMKKGKR